MKLEFIVAEVSKNWLRTDPLVAPSQSDLLSERFEHVIEVNRQRGYELHSFQFNRIYLDPGGMNETIIAVFRLKESP